MHFVPHVYILRAFWVYLRCVNYPFPWPWQLVVRMRLTGEILNYVASWDTISPVASMTISFDNLNYRHVSWPGVERDVVYMRDSLPDRAKILPTGNMFLVAWSRRAKHSVSISSLFSIFAEGWSCLFFFLFGNINPRTCNARTSS